MPNLTYTQAALQILNEQNKELNGNEIWEEIQNKNLLSLDKKFVNFRDEINYHIRTHKSPLFYYETKNKIRYYGLNSWKQNKKKVKKTEKQQSLFEITEDTQILKSTQSTEKPIQEEPIIKVKEQPTIQEEGTFFLPTNNTQKPRFLRIEHNGLEVEEVKDFDLFPEIYDGDFFGITYSISPKLVKDKLSHFDNVNLIVGIKDDSYQAKTINSIVNHNLNNALELKDFTFFNDLDISSQLKIKAKKLNIYSPTFVVHTKLFIMTNKNNTLFRVIKGSANLSLAALEQSNQFEDIQIFDGNSKENFEILSNSIKRFEEIKSTTKDFISEKLREKIISNEKGRKNKLKKSSSINIISLNNNFNENNPSNETTIENDSPSNISIDAEELNSLNKPIFISLTDFEKQEIIQEEIIEFNQNLTEQIEKIENQEYMGEILQIDAISDAKEELKKIETSFKLKKKIITIDKINNKPKLEQNKIKIAKYVSEIWVPSIESEFSSKDHLIRFHLKRLDNAVSNNNIEGNILHVKNENEILPYSKFASKEIIAQSLKNIDYLIKGYEKYLTNYSNDIGKKIFEIILCAFTAPFMSYIRKSVSNNETRQNLPIFLFIGGIGGAGKSSLLKAVSRMIKDDHSIKDFINYGAISKHNSPSQKTTETKTYIKNLMRENNVFPLLIDEIPPTFFENKNMGEEIIKETSNIIDEQSYDYPIFIGTTNCSNYSMEYSATRRSYYLKLDVPFKETARGESTSYHEKILQNLTTDLFKDFLCRFHEKTLNPDTKFIENDKNGNIDFLAVARNIFKEYYELAELPTPIYFNDSKLNDYRDACREKWHDLFNSEKDNLNIFSYDKEHDVLYFTPSELNKNQKMHQERLADSYINDLPNEVANKSNNAFKIKIKGKEFFEWLQITNPYIKKTWWNKIFN